MTDLAADPSPSTEGGGLSLSPFRARRYADQGRLAARLSPPYDVVDDAERAELLAADPDNIVAVILPRTEDGSDPYDEAARRVARWCDDASGDPVLALDDAPALYVYDMASAHGTTRGLVGALELRDPADGVVLPHEDVMAGPVADRLALMAATDANLEPIYLVYPGGGAASALVAAVDAPGTGREPVVDVTTPDGTRHRLWAVTDPATHQAVAADLAGHTAVIADGHHRYATYRELQRRRRTERGAGPWDRGLTLLVDTSAYGANVEAIHRVLPGHDLAGVRARLEQVPDLVTTPVSDVRAALAELDAAPRGATTTVLLADATGAVRVEGLRGPTTVAGADLDVVAVHRDLIEGRLELEDTVDTVRYAHDLDEALALAQVTGGVAVLLRPTPVEAVVAVARAGGRMPRKSTLFVPKPASGLLLRRFADADGGTGVDADVDAGADASPADTSRP